MQYLDINSIVQKERKNENEAPTSLLLPPANLVLNNNNLLPRLEWNVRQACLMFDVIIVMITRGEPHLKGSGSAGRTIDRGPGDDVATAS